LYKDLLKYCYMSLSIVYLKMKTSQMKITDLGQTHFFCHVRYLEVNLHRLI